MQRLRICCRSHFLHHCSQRPPVVRDSHGNRVKVTGLLRCTAKGSEILAGALKQLSTHADFKKLRFDALFAHLLQNGVQIKVCYITGHWLEVDRLEDLAEAQTF